MTDPFITQSTPLPEILDRGGLIAQWVSPYAPWLDPSTVQQWATDHQKQATRLTENANESELSYSTLFREVAKGKTGDAIQMSLGNNQNLWHSHAMYHHDAFTALNSAAGYLQGLCADLMSIVDHYEPLYDTANNKWKEAELNGDAVQAQFYGNEAYGYQEQAINEAKSAAQHAAASISRALNGKFGEAPAGFNQIGPDFGNGQTGTRPWIQGGANN